MAEKKTSEARRRRNPTQHRAQQTVAAILDAVVRVLKRDGLEHLTTNRIAEVAGVSIGSLYQYFPDKNAIFAALHQRHLDEIDRVIQTTLILHADSSLEDLIRALVDSMADAHSGDPELYDMLMTQVPHRAGGTQDFAARLHGIFRLALASKANELPQGRNLDTTIFIVSNMMDSLCHGAVLRRPPGLSFVEAKKEAARAILAYLRSRDGSPSALDEPDLAKWFLR
jgi:AcrR family transcriptional regulator